MTLKTFLRIVIDLGYARFNGSRDPDRCTPTEGHVGRPYPITMGGQLVRPHHMEGEVLVDAECDGGRGFEVRIP